MFEKFADTLTGGQLSQARQNSEQMQRTTEDLRLEVHGLTRQVEGLKDGSIPLKEDYADNVWFNRFQQDRNWVLMSGATRHRVIQKMETEWYADMANFMYTFNPLIRRAVDVKTQFTFIKGFSVVSKAKTLQKTIDTIIDDPLNQQAFFSKQAITEIDAELQKTGNIFIAVFSKTMPVQVRVFSTYEIADSILDPDDASRPLFYVRSWTDAKGGQQRRLYPSAFNERPMINLTDQHSNIEIDRNVVVYHMSAKKSLKQKWALTELTPALRWAKAHEGFLEDFGAIVRAIRKYSTMFTTKGGPGQVTGLATQFAGSTQNFGTPLQSQPSGSMLVAQEGNDLKVVDAGASKIVGAADGRYFLLMVCAAMGVPETILVGDPTRGNLATAKELTGPFISMIEDRQNAWRSTLQIIFTQVLGKGSTFEVSFPPMRLEDTAPYIQSLISAATLDGKAPAGTLKMTDFISALYEALEIDLPDEVRDELVAGINTLTQPPKTPPDPQQPPQPPSQATVAAVNRLANATRALEGHLQVMEATQAGVPKPVLTTAASARDQFKKDIEGMRNDIASILGI